MWNRGKKMLSIGIDIGSTTVKLVVLRDGVTVYQQYERHMSRVRQKALELIENAKGTLDEPFTVALSGSAGLGLAKTAGLPFIQEVFATGEVISVAAPDTDVVIELGGEDAKIIFFSGGLEERMNGSCAGGTGAFIDQMATLLDVTPEQLDTLALASQRLYPIASRCGVFAKSDIQPLLNQGAQKEDIAASIFKAVVDQTITGLAQGRRIVGKVLFLGGPLFYFKGLQREFVRTLKLEPKNAVFPEMGRYAVALGSALYAQKTSDPIDYETLVRRVTDAVGNTRSAKTMQPLFTSQQEYDSFCARHAQADVKRIPLESYQGDAYLGIDCGSTTTKLVLITGDGDILYDYYGPNKGDPVSLLHEKLLHLRESCPDGVRIRAAASTGYGEELVKTAFSLDAGLVETMAHFKAARRFSPNVDFILDIGGQDMKCFHIRDSAIDSILLNEACSSGCGSFISTFAQSMGYDVANFAKLGLFARNPVDLGSRCTVFMNSSVKQAQKEGACVEDISAGISISVVKNAVYKVIRAADASDLGENIVVQGGTFLNDAVLRAFEMELGHPVVRPVIAGLMGAYGAALYAQQKAPRQSALLSLEALRAFTHSSAFTRCGLCSNHCGLTVTTFPDGRRSISGNRCSRPLGGGSQTRPGSIYAYKTEKLAQMQGKPGPRGKIGLPLGLNYYELLPFWYQFFTTLGFEVVHSGLSTRETYTKGQFSIPSDTVCYPAKLMHGHIVQLLEKGIDHIFYPCLTYNIDEGRGDNHYNCPVVAYYPELLYANVEELSAPGMRFYHPHICLDNPKHFAKEMHSVFQEEYGFSLKEIRAATDAAYEAQEKWRRDIHAEGARLMARARENGGKIVILASRPYHADPEINHGMDAMLESYGLTVVSEDAVAEPARTPRVHVLNQWTYHSRLYNAAQYACEHDDTELVQLVSFGCGIDAITTDEVREILQASNKLCTQIKIDEISNLGAARIRVRSLLAALEERERSVQKPHAN